MIYFFYLLLNWINFITLLFWFILFMFLLNSIDLTTIILYSETIWVLLYTYTAIVGTINDDLVLVSTTFFLLALAGLEFCIGFIITIFYRNFKKSFNLDQLNNFSSTKQLKNLSINRYIWSFNKK